MRIGMNLTYCRWAEISGQHIELAVGDICDWEFFGEVFKWVWILTKPELPHSYLPHCLHTGP